MISVNDGEPALAFVVFQSLLLIAPPGEVEKYTVLSFGAFIEIMILLAPAIAAPPFKLVQLTPSSVERLNKIVPANIVADPAV